jgi:hypothetical protein
MQQSNLHELWQESHRHVGEEPPKRIVQRAPPACRVHNPGCSVAIVMNNRFLPKVLMDAAISAINDTISHKHRNVANTRLHRYNEKSVTFWYKDREGERHFVTMEVREFIKALIQHIPDRQFKMIRYYGAYSRRTKGNYSGYSQRSIRQTTFEDFTTEVNKWVPECPICGRKMTFVCYEKGPPIENDVFGCTLSDWNHLLLSAS